MKISKETNSNYFSLFGLLIKQSPFLKIFKSRFKSHRIPNSELRERALKVD